MNETIWVKIFFTLADGEVFEAEPKLVEAPVGEAVEVVAQAVTDALQESKFIYIETKSGGFRILNGANVMDVLVRK